MSDDTGKLVLEIVNMAFNRRVKSFFQISQYADDILSYAVYQTFLAVERFNPARAKDGLRGWLLYVADRAIRKQILAICRKKRILPTKQFPSVPIDYGDEIVYEEYEPPDKSTMPYYEPLLDEMAHAESDSMKPIVRIHKLRRLRNAYRNP